MGGKMYTPINNWYKVACLPEQIKVHFIPWNNYFTLFFVTDLFTSFVPFKKLEILEFICFETEVRKPYTYRLFNISPSGR